MRDSRVKRSPDSSVDAGMRSQPNTENSGQETHIHKHSQVTTSNRPGETPKHDTIRES